MEVLNLKIEINNLRIREVEAHYNGTLSRLVCLWFIIKAVENMRLHDQNLQQTLT